MFHSPCVSMADVWPTSANLLPKTFADLGVQILSTFGPFHPSGNMWAIREEAHSFSITPVSCVTKRVEDVMPALQAYRARKRELRCVATEIVQEPGSSPDLLMVQDCTEWYALATSDDKPRALLEEQPQKFTMIFRSLRFHHLPCCELGRRSRMSVFTGEESSSACGCGCSLSTPPPPRLF